MITTKPTVITITTTTVATITTMITSITMTPACWVNPEGVEDVVVEEDVVVDLAGLVAGEAKVSVVSVVSVV